MSDERDLREVRPIERVEVFGLEAEDGEVAVGIRLTFQDGEVVEGRGSVQAARALAMSLEMTADGIDPASRN